MREPQDSNSPDYSGLYAKLVNLLVWQGCSRPDAEDIASSALIETVARRHSVRKPVAYLAKLAKRRRARLAERRRRELVVDLDSQGGRPDPATADRYFEAEADTTMREFLTILEGRPKQQSVAAMAFDGYTNREIAEKLGMSRKAVSANLYHARLALKGCWSDDDRRFLLAGHQAWEAFQCQKTVLAAPSLRIWEAWRRAKDLGVDPNATAAVVPLDRDELAFRRRQSLLGTSGSWVLPRLADLGNDAGLMMAVTDGRGLVLWRGGDRNVMRKADQAGFVQGVCWDFANAGNGGISMALETRRMALVRRWEHFVAAQHQMTCVATAVCSPHDGQVMCVLNLTGTKTTIHYAIRRELDTLARRLKQEAGRGRV